LFRFFDFSVKPGKSYIYRVNLVLENPNYGCRPSQLKNASLGKDRYIETKEPVVSNEVHVDNVTRLLVKKIVDKNKPSMMLIKWIEDTGQEVYKDFEFERGQVLNYSEVTGLKSPTPPAPTKPVDFNADATVLDITGGKKLIGRDQKLTDPFDVLVMIVNDNKVTLQVRNELSDFSEIDQLKPPETPTGPGPGAGHGPRIIQPHKP
jgi:hypothetical protein